MKILRKNYLFMIVIFFFIFYILTHYPMILNSVATSFTVWKDNIFPSLFPMFVLTNILINYGFVEVCAKSLQNFFNKIFKINANTSFVFVMGLLSGFPSSAKYAKELYENDLISKNDITKIICFSHFSNPLFIIGTIGLSFLNNKKLGLLILVCHYLANVFIGLIYRNYLVSEKIIDNSSKRKEESFGSILSSSISKSIDTLLIILGTVVILLIITSIINNIFNFNPIFESIICGILEMTNGLKQMSLLDIPIKLKGILALSFISFGGLSVHAQIFSIVSDLKIKYLPFLLARILHVIISVILFIIIYNFI